MQRNTSEEIVAIVLVANATVLVLKRGIKRCRNKTKQITPAIILEDPGAVGRDGTK